MEKRKFDKYADAEEKKLCFEEDYEDELYDFNERIEKFLENYDCYYGEESIFDFWEGRQQTSKDALQFLEIKAKPFFDKHSKLYGRGIYEIYEEMCQEVYNYRNNFISDDLPEIKKDITTELAEENARIEENKNLKVKIMQKLIEQGKEVKRSLFIREIGENELQAIEAIDEMAASQFLTKTKKGNIYYISVIPNITTADIVNEAEAKIEANTDFSKKVLAFNPKIEKMPKLTKTATIQEEQTYTRPEVDHAAQLEKNIEQFQQSYERGKKLYTWDNIKTLLLHVIALPTLVFLVVGLATSPGFGALAMAITGGIGIYKFWKKIKDI